MMSRSRFAPLAATGSGSGSSVAFPAAASAPADARAGEHHIRERYRAAILAAAARAARVPLRYGKDDCVLFVADIDRAVSGVDPAAAFRGRYRTLRGAKRMLGRRGLAGAAAAAARRLGWRRIAPAEAQAGDRAIADTPDGPVALIFSGAYWFHRVADGVAAYRFAADGFSPIRRAWSIA